MSLFISNAVVPTLLFAWPALAVWVLVFAVVVEAICYKYLLGVHIDAALLASAKANAFSTLVGIPIAGILLLIVVVALASVIELQASQIGWFLIPFGFISETPEKYQLASTMGIVALLIVFLVLSARLERHFIESLVDDGRTNVARAVWIAHFITYVPLVGLVLFATLS